MRVCTILAAGEVNTNAHKMRSIKSASKEDPALAAGTPPQCAAKQQRHGRICLRQDLVHLLGAILSASSQITNAKFGRIAVQHLALQCTSASWEWAISFRTDEVDQAGIVKAGYDPAGGIVGYTLSLQNPTLLHVLHAPCTA